MSRYSLAPAVSCASEARRRSARQSSQADENRALFSDPIVCSGVPLHSPFELDDAGSLVANSVTPAETRHGVVLRLHETMGRAGTARLTVSGKARLSTMRLDETVDEALETQFDGNSTSAAIVYTPCRITRVRIESA